MTAVKEKANPIRTNNYHIFTGLYYGISIFSKPIGRYGNLSHIVRKRDNKETNDNFLRFWTEINIFFVWWIKTVLPEAFKT